MSRLWSVVSKVSKTEQFSSWTEKFEKIVAILKGTKTSNFLILLILSIASKYGRTLIKSSLGRGINQLFQEFMNLSNIYFMFHIFWWKQFLELNLNGQLFNQSFVLHILTITIKIEVDMFKDVVQLQFTYFNHKIEVDI